MPGKDQENNLLSTYNTIRNEKNKNKNKSG
jgi:hypothetical protein